MPNSERLAATKRSYGTGSLYSRNGKWYGHWRARGSQIKRVVGKVRKRGTREGLTRAQAEARLRKMMEETKHAPIQERLTIEQVGTRHLQHLKRLKRKRSTRMDYESYLRVHISPFFGSKTVDRITPDDVEEFINEKLDDGLAVKSVLNYLGFLHSIFNYGVKRKWCRTNPCKEVDKPEYDSDNADIRFLTPVEVEMLLTGVPKDDLGETDRVLYLTAAMTGMRQGELLALRWKDIDWVAGRVRIRRNYVRGEYGTPKSKRSTRSVPLADRLAGQLDEHFKQSSYTEDDDLVFPHPETGKPLDRSRVLKRFKAALRRSDIGQFKEAVNKKGEKVKKPLTRFHDLRHTFGTRMAASGVAIRTLQEWMGHKDFKTTLIYADYAPSTREGELVEQAFALDDDVARESGRGAARAA